MSDCPDVPEPKNLKDVLDLFEVLSASQLEEIVGKELDGRVKDFFSLKDVPKSVSGYRSISQNFYNVIHELREIRKVIVQNTAQDTYGIYSILASSNVDATCAKHCANRILTILPRLYTTLLFLKFQVEDNHSLGGGTWEEQQCGGGEDSASGKDALSHWLKSLQTGLHSAQHSESLRSETSPTLLPGGYEGDLSNTLGGEFVTPLSNLITDSGEDEGYLQYFLLDLVVITEYSHCNLATCLVVVRALCKTYTSSFQNQGQVISDPESVLKSIATKLKALAPEEADGDVSNALLTALFDGSPSKYSEHLKAAYFEGHMKWLSSIFDELTASLKLLGEESMKWDKAGLTNAKIAGPFGYGFSFSEQWKGEWKDDVAKTKIPDAIQTLTSGLEELKTILEQSNTSAVSRTSGSTGYTSAITRTPGSSEPGSDNPCTLESSGTVTEVPVPKNLKEAIDWVLRVSNKDGQGCDGDKGIEGLSQAIVSLLGKAKLDDNQSITTKLQSVITALAEGFCLFIGYDGSHRQKPNGNAMASKLYSSTYEIGTRWNPSWNSNSNSDSQKCATIFLACVPLFYFAMTYLHWRCTSVNGCKGDWELMCFNGEYKHDLNGSNSNPLNYFMAAVGYSDKSQLSNESGNDVMAKLKTTFNELDTTSYPESAPLYGYFLNKVEKVGKESLTSTPEKCPLYTLHRAAGTYWKSVSETSRGINTVVEHIATTLKETTTEQSNMYERLTGLITELTEKIKTFATPPAPPGPGSDERREPGFSETVSSDESPPINNEQPQQQAQAAGSVTVAAGGVAASGGMPDGAPGEPSGESTTAGSERESQGLPGTQGLRGDTVETGERGPSGNTSPSSPSS